MLNVLLVTSWGVPCGISEHSAMLKEAVEQADPKISIEPWSDLAPSSLARHEGKIDIVHLNYHAALHAAWDVQQVEDVRAAGVKVVITYHDTTAGTPDAPNSERCHQLFQVADRFVVHEPVEDLACCDKLAIWRQGVPTLGRELEQAYYAGAQPPNWPIKVTFFELGELISSPTSPPLPFRNPRQHLTLAQVHLSLTGGFALAK